jgi:uncharacterized protein (DUF58 family)
MKSDQPPLEDPTALARFGKLDLIARLLIEGFMMGQHKSPFKGSSVEFVEHRQYYPGDEIRHIDWRAYGKTGKYYIKEYEEDTNLRAYMLVDGSGSMAYSGATVSKYGYARMMAASLGYLLHTQRDAIGLRLFDHKVQFQLEPATSAMHYQQIINALENHQPHQETSLGSVFQTIIPRLKRRSLIVIISDFYDHLESLTTAIKHFRHAHHEVIVLAIHAPEEEEFPFRSPTQFHDLEHPGHKILVDPHRMRSLYQQQYREYLKKLQDICVNAGVDYCRLLTNQPLHEGIGYFLDARARRMRR